MSLFLVRVELHYAGDADYQTLHAAMKNLGFSQIIVQDRVQYYLPTAEYAISSSLDVSAIRDLAKRAANSTGRTSWIIAVQSAGMAWDLRVAK